MKHGELIRKLRLERNLTQSQLSAGISSRNALCSFEISGNHVSIDNLARYCERMNVTLEEYEFLYSGAVMTKKREIANEVSKALKRHYDAAICAELLGLYYETHDFFYYSLYAQYYLVASFKSGNLKTLKVRQITANVTKHLNSIDVWGRFELVLFTNCLFLFEDEYIKCKYKDVVTKMLSYKDTSNYSSDLLKFLINGAQLTLDRGDYALFKAFYGELQQVKEQFLDLRCNIACEVFSIVIRHKQGKDNIDELNMFVQLLRTIDATSWIRYLDKHLTE